jgi:hypothetical protein
MRKPLVPEITALLACIGTVTLTFAQGLLPHLEGSKPYTPTRLEWLAVELNSEMRKEPTELSEYLITFAPLPKEDAILIIVRYLPSVDRIPESRQRMNLTLDTARKVIAIKAIGRGWSSWLKVKERIELAEPQ